MGHRELGIAELDLTPESPIMLAWYKADKAAIIPRTDHVLSPSSSSATGRRATNPGSGPEGTASLFAQNTLSSIIIIITEADIIDNIVSEGVRREPSGPGLGRSLHCITHWMLSFLFYLLFLLVRVALKYGHFDFTHLVCVASLYFDTTRHLPRLCCFAVLIQTNSFLKHSNSLLTEANTVKALPLHRTASPRADETSTQPTVPSARAQVITQRLSIRTKTATDHSETPSWPPFIHGFLQGPTNWWRQSHKTCSIASRSSRRSRPSARRQSSRRRTKTGST